MNTNFQNIEKILVIKLRHIGDVLLTVPVYRALKEHFPSASISVLVNSGTEAVLEGNPLINEIIVFDRGIKKMRPAEHFIREVFFFNMIRRKGFDMAVDLTSGDRAALLSFFSGARYRLAYDPKNSGMLGKRLLYTHPVKKTGSTHTVIKNMNIVRQFGIDTKDLSVDFFIPEEARAFARKVFSDINVTEEDRIIHVHPTSRWLFKCWKDEYMALLIAWFVEKGMKVILTSSPDREELEKAARIQTLTSERLPADSMKSIIDLCGKTNLKELAAISKASSLFFGVDTAPMHIAAAVGTPVVALFGMGMKHWRPWGDGHIVISKGEEDKCRGDKKEFIRRNLERITPEEVKVVIESFFDRN